MSLTFVMGDSDAPSGVSLEPSSDKELEEGKFPARLTPVIALEFAIPNSRNVSPR